MLHDVDRLVQPLKPHIPLPNAVSIMKWELRRPRGHLGFFQLLEQFSEGRGIQVFEDEGIEGDEAVGHVLGDGGKTLAS